MKRTGQCMCGDVTFSAETDDGYAACYCKMCQRWSAGMFMGVHAKSFEITQGVESLTVFKSSDWAERAFCATCGSNVYYRLAGKDGASFGLGTLDNTDGLTLEREFFVDLRPESISISSQTHAMTSAEIMEKYGLE